MAVETMETRAMKYELEIEIDAEPSAVWEALVNETNLWWLPDFHMGGPDSKVTLDPRAGGQLVEQVDGGMSLLWYTVTACTPGESLELVGSLSPDFGGPSTSMLGLKLEEQEDGSTLLRVRDALVGHITDKGLESTMGGWTQLFEQGLKAHISA